MEGNALLQACERELPAVLGLSERLVNMDSGTDDLPGLRRKAEALKALFEEAGGSVRLLEAAPPKHLLVSLFVDTDVQRQHQRVSAKAAEPALYRLGIFTAVEPTTTRATPASNSAATSSSVRTPPPTCDRTLRPRPVFQQRDLAFGRIFRAGKINQMQHFCTLRSIVLQAWQRIVAIVALLAIIALVQTDNRAVD